MYARAYARAYDCGQIATRTRTRTRTRLEHAPPEKGGTQANIKTKFAIMGRSTRQK